uniref:F-box domain-containing protein n=1 Tax=Strongyloides papillosus TaxID=174720 RepID=A0A0N5BQE7_STREA
MDFLSLPDQFKLPILKKLHWKDLNNLKLVCRDLCLTVLRNIEELDRPKVEYLKIYYGENKIFGVDYCSKCPTNIGDNVVPHRIDFNDDREYEIFLKDKDFTDIKKLVFLDVENDELIIIENNTDNRRRIFNYDNFDVILSDGTFEYLLIKICKSKNFGGIPFNGTLLKKESLEKMGLFEGCGLYLILKQITDSIICGNTMGEYENVLIDAVRLNFVKILNHISNYRCDIEEFECSICQSGEIISVKDKAYYMDYTKL